MWKQGRDDGHVRDVLRGHCREGMAPGRASAREVRTAVAAELADRHEGAAVRTRDERGAADRARARLARSPPRRLAPVRTALFHDPPPLTYWIQAESRAAASMLPQPVAKSQPVPASKPRLLPWVTSWKGLGLS